MDAYKNFTYGLVLTPPTPAVSGGTLVLAAGHGARFPTPPFNATVWPAGAIPDGTNAEIVRVTAIATDTLTITRAAESSTARAILAGDQIAASITKGTLDAMRIEADEIWIGPDPPPAGLGYEFWFDTDAAVGAAGGAHAPTHETGGADPITKLDAGILLSGTLADARLSANVARRDQANTFTGLGTFPGLDIPSTGGASILLRYTNAAAPVDQKNFQIVTDGAWLYFRGLNDAQAAATPGLRINRSGALFERDRAVAIGEWIDYTPVWKCVSTQAQPVIGNGAMYGRYTLIGKTVTFQIRLVIGSTTTGGPGGGSGWWFFTLPTGTAGTTLIPTYGGWYYTNTGAYFDLFGMPGNWLSGEMANTVALVRGDGSVTPVVSASYPIAMTAPAYVHIQGTYETP